MSRSGHSPLVNARAHRLGAERTILNDRFREQYQRMLGILARKAALDDARGLCDALGLLEGKRGKDWHPQAGGAIVLCPWHDERSPSCSVSRGRDGTVRVKCFGCGATGDALTLVAARHRLDLAGDFVEYTIGDEAVLVTRQDDGSIRAFANVCLHRGARLATGCGHAAATSAPVRRATTVRPAECRA